ncbi:hypothetical protein [Psychrilyobacter atlanticus]|uniref:hypothetical protein n=1 Tax=Psychrilyobacter atlanticus TaxID=271091 RepID=UPI0004901AD2|nr:hypothetical protein [Psychrilyobacter atlanticus]
MRERTNKYKDDVKKYNIIPLENVQKLTTHIIHKCLVCGKEFKGCPKDIKSGKTGCHFCRKKSRIENSRKSHEEFIKNLVDGIIVHGTYIKSIAKIKVECTKCGYIWNVIPANIQKIKPGNKRRATGCPKCSGRLKFGIEEYKQSLIQKKIKLINNPTDANDKIEHLCLVCNNHWNVKPTTINQGHGCPVCAAAKVGKTKRLDVKTVDKIFKTKKIKLLTPYEGMGKKHQLKCLNEECNYIWEATLAHLICDELAGCPKCSKGGQSLGEKIFEDFLIKEKIEYTYRAKPSWLKTNRHFDFYIRKKNLFVEIDGAQHFHPSGGYFGGEDGFKSTRIRDIEKMEKALKRGFSILRITNYVVKRKSDLLHILMARSYKGLNCVGEAYYEVEDFFKYNPTFIKSEYKKHRSHKTQEACELKKKV